MGNSLISRAHSSSSARGVQNQVQAPVKPVPNTIQEERIPLFIREREQAKNMNTKIVQERKTIQTNNQQVNSLKAGNNTISISNNNRSS